MGSVSFAALMVAASAVADVQLLFFSSQACLPCQQVKPVVAQLAGQGYPIVSVDINQRADLADQYQIQQIPCFVLTVRGQEVSRLVGLQSATALQTWMQASLSLNTPNTASAPIQQPVQVPTATHPNPPPGLLNAGPIPPANPVPAAGQPSMPQNPGFGKDQNESGNMQLVSTQNGSRVQQKALAATVRIHVDEPQAFAVGSGTVIHQSGDSILILTCGHLFREAGNQARVKVDAGFPHQVVTGLDARVRYYDSEKHDIALVVAHTRQRFEVARIAPPQLPLHSGDQVFGVGCSGGDVPTLLATRIKALTNYSGVTKVDTFVRPEQGRSGGGLFSAGGQLIGVCNAAAVNVDEGIYAGAQSIYAALDAVGLREMVTGPEPQLLAAGPGVAGMQASAQPRAVTVPSVGSRAPAGLQDRGVTSVGNQARPLEPLAVPVTAPATPQEITVLVRSAADPNKAEIMTLSNPSPEFLQMLRREQQRSQAAASDSRLRSMIRPPRDANIRAQSPEGSTFR